MATDTRLTKRAADLAVREMYLTNFWYAATFSRELSAKKPFRTKLLDTDVLLWRDKASGQVVCMTARSPVTGLPIPADQQVTLTVYNQEGEVRPMMCAPTTTTMPSGPSVL